MPSRSTVGMAPALDAHLPGDPFAVALVEVQTTVTISPSTSTVGAMDRQGAVEEEHVLHVQHQLLGHARPVAEESRCEARISAVISSAVRVVGSMVGRSRPRSRMTASMSILAGSAPEIAQRGDLPGDVVGRRRHDQTEKAPPLSVSFNRPVMPKSSRATRPSAWTRRLPPCRSPWKTP